MVANIPTKQSKQSLLQLVLKNSELIDSLANGAIHKQDLAKQLDVSAKTVYRRGKELEKFDIIHRSQEGYQLTEKGHIFARLIIRCQLNIENIYHSINTDSLFLSDNLPPHWIFILSSITTTDDILTYLPRHQPASRATKRIKGVVPTLTSETVERLIEKISLNELYIDLVVEEQFASELLQIHSEIFHRKQDRISLMIAEEDLPYGTLLLENGESATAITILYDINYDTLSHLKSDNPGIIGWVTKRFNTQEKSSNTCAWK